MTKMPADFSQTGQVTSDGRARRSPFEIAIGARFHHLMPQVRQLHGGRAPAWRGQVTVTPSTSVFGRFLAGRVGLPSAMANAPFRLGILTNSDGSETWTRDFDGHVLTSRLWADPDTLVLRESMGSVELHLAAQVKVDSLHCGVDRAFWAGRLALPRALTPVSSSVIWQDEAGRYRFDIKAELPRFGPLIRYRGWLRPDVQSAFVTQ